MWLSRLHAIALLATLALGGCGFTPVYATHADQNAGMQARLENVEVGMIADREGQYLRNALLDKMGSRTTGTGQRYFLRVAGLHQEDLSFGIRKNASATRGDITITATMELIDTQTNAVILSRSLRARGGYNRMDNLYGAQIARQDTVDRLLNEMAERTVTELTLYFSRKEN